MNRRLNRALGVFLGLVTLLSGCTAQFSKPMFPTPVDYGSKISGAPQKLKIGIVVFLTGGAADPFGLPAKNGAEAIIADLNSGGAPAPYDTPGIGGVQIEAIYIDEAGGPDTQVEEARRLYENEQVDLIIGYISSSDCLAVAPVAEEMQKLLVAFDCGTSRLFEEQDYHFVFRTNAHQAIDSIGGALYLTESFPELETIAGINQNYAWGQDSWSHFRDSIMVLRPDVRIVSEQFPKLGAGVYRAELEALAQDKPDVIHSSFWGQDLEDLVFQIHNMNGLSASRLLLSVGESSLVDLGDTIPVGTIVGAHGPHGALAPQGPLQDWLVSLYNNYYGSRPTYPVYHMAQAILGVKMAYENAAAKKGSWPTLEEFITAFTYLEYPTPSGTITMAIGKGHQAIEPAVFGTAGEFNPITGEVDLFNVVEYPAECVNPPEGKSTEQWIREGLSPDLCSPDK